MVSASSVVRPSAVTAAKVTVAVVAPPGSGSWAVTVTPTSVFGGAGASTVQA